MGEVRDLPGHAGGNDRRRRSGANGRVSAAKRRHQVITLLTAGRSTEEVAKTLGLTVKRVDKIVTAVLESWSEQDLRAVEATRELQLRRIDTLVAKLWASATGVPEREGEPSRQPNLKAVAEIRNLEALRARIAGTEAAKRVEVGGTLGFTLDAGEVNVLEETWKRGAIDVTDAEEVPAGELTAGPGAE